MSEHRIVVATRGDHSMCIAAWWHASFDRIASHRGTVAVSVLLGGRGECTAVVRNGVCALSDREERCTRIDRDGDTRVACIVNA